jgi:hypothetical protein
MVKKAFSPTRDYCAIRCANGPCSTVIQAEPRSAPWRAMVRGTGRNALDVLASRYSGLALLIIDRLQRRLCLTAPDQRAVLLVQPN